MSIRRPRRNLPLSGYHAKAYDGAMLAIKAIEKVAKEDKDGNLFIGKKALRDAVSATRFDVIDGPIACDAWRMLAVQSLCSNSLRPTRRR